MLNWASIFEKWRKSVCEGKGWKKGGKRCGDRGQNENKLVPRKE